MKDHERSGLIVGLSTLWLVACGSEAPPADPCAPHGMRHGSHCDCDPGYRDDGLSCVPRADAGIVDASTPVGTDGGPGAPDTGAVAGCGPHGEDHGGHCHCDPGYVEIEHVCVEPPPCVGPDDALEENDTPATASSWAASPDARDLYSCIVDEDWYAVDAAVGARIEVAAAFTHADSDIDVLLFAPGSDPTHDAPLAAGDSTDDDESLSFVATTTGAHWIVVYGYDAREAPYSLRVNVIAP